MPRKRQTFSKDGNRPRRVRGHFRLLTKWVELASGGAGIVRFDWFDWTMDQMDIRSIVGYRGIYAGCTLAEPRREIWR